MRTSLELKKTTNPTELRDFRVYLQNELIERTRRNPKYSLRAFAKFLGAQPGFVSKILLGQRSVTLTTIKRFGLRLGLNPREIDSFETALIDLKAQKKNGVASLSEGLAENYKNLAMDHFQIISDWYHFAILQLTAIEHFQPNSKWISKALGITTSEVNAAIERLQRLELLEITDSGEWIVHEGLQTTTLNHEFSTAAFRKLQKQILEMAILSLENEPIERRNQTAMTMAIDSSRLPKAIEMITQFRRSLSRFLESGEKKDHVYHLSVSLYPVTKNFNGGKNA
jgi:uncharacterized protein (TIGR02147 family)